MSTKRVIREHIFGTSERQDSEMSVKEVLDEVGIPYETFLSWRDTYANTEVSDATRLHELESENAKLRNILEKMDMKNALSKRW